MVQKLESQWSKCAILAKKKVVLTKNVTVDSTFGGSNCHLAQMSHWSSTSLVWWNFHHWWSRGSGSGQIHGPEMTTFSHCNIFKPIHWKTKPSQVCDYIYVLQSLTPTATASRKSTCEHRDGAEVKTFMQKNRHTIVCTYDSAPKKSPTDIFGIFHRLIS